MIMGEIGRGAGLGTSIEMLLKLSREYVREAVNVMQMVCEAMELDVINQEDDMK